MVTVTMVVGAEGTVTNSLYFDRKTFLMNLANNAWQLNNDLN